MLYFCTIVEQGQISRAARVLNMAQPPLSQRLRELEDEFGCKLFLRKGHTLTLTEAGQVLYQRAREILRSVEETRSEVIRVASQTEPALRIGLSPTCKSFLLSRFRALHAWFPERQIGLIAGDSSYLETLLLAGKLDIALMQPPMQAEKFAIYPIMTSKTVAVAAQGILPATVRSLSLAELSRHPLLLLRRSVGVGSYERLLQSMHDAGLNPWVAFYSSDVELLLDLLNQGFAGVAVVPESETAKVGKAYPVVPIDIDLPDYHLSVVCRRGAQTEAPVSRLLAFWQGDAQDCANGAGEVM